MQAGSAGLSKEYATANAHLFPLPLFLAFIIISFTLSHGFSYGLVIKSITATFRI